MNYKFLFIIATLALIGFMSGCKDIVTTDPNIVAVPIDTTKVSNSIINFNFFNEAKFYKVGESVPTWRVNKPSYWEKNFYIFNLSKKDKFVIYSISLESGKYYSIYSYQPLPVILNPYNLSDTISFKVILDAMTINEGFYSDRIIINNDKYCGVTVNTQVVN